MAQNKISTGSYDLNTWLYGGYEKDIITMIAGPPGSGKTNFAISAACSQAKKGNKVLFIDTEGGFSIERIKQIAEENQEEVLRNILLLKPTNFEEQKEIINNIKTQLKKESISLIIIDGMAMLYRLELGDNRKDDDQIKNINREVAKQMRDLAEISRKQEIPVIITNQVYSQFLSDEDIRNGIEKETNIVGGDLFKYWSKCIIQLSNENRRKKAFLLKHRFLPQREIIFEIKNKGIFKKGLF
ncbi:MAG: DNA repair and recombination protein RadB [Candidatus Nanoarchaeia archaeon]